MIKKITFVYLVSTMSFFSFSQVTENTTRKDTLTNDQDVPTFTTTLDDLDNGSGSSQSTSNLLQSSRDVFSAAAAFNFGVARFRIRGYNSDQNTIMINGMPMNDLESGRGTWYKWGGLNDVTRYAESKTWLTSNPYHFAGLGGYSNINAKATGIRKGNHLSYASTNRAYRHRLMFTKSTGMMKNGWAFAGSLSLRYAQEGYVEGTFYEAMGYYLAAEKQLNKSHNLNLSILGAPSSRARNGIATQEVYDLTGDNYYNSNWGHQTEPDGTVIKRNSRQSISHMPIINLNHDWIINAKSKLKTTLTSSFGKYGRTSLNWTDAKDPRPDYYKNLPSYFYGRNDSLNGDILREKWLNDESFGQVKWDELYYTNKNNPFQQKDANGVTGNNVTGLRSKYIVENRWNNLLSYGLGSNYNNKLSDNAELVMGLTMQYQRNHVYTTVQDLLGGEFWVDIDRFATQVGVDPEIAQNDINNPNKLAKVGDKIGHNYYIHNSKAAFFSQLNYQFNKFEVYGAVELSANRFYREGINQNGKFPNNSKGNSKIASFINPSVKAGLTYKISGRQFLTLNALVKTQAPFSRNSFISPRTRDFLVDDLKSEFVYSGDASYILRFPNLKLRASYYYTERKDVNWSRSFYHDEYNSFVNYTMKGVNYLHHGIELGVDGKLIGGLSANAALAYSQSLYTSRPTASIYVDNSAQILAKDKRIYLKNYRVGGMPQSAVSVGLKYRSKKYWFISANFNYFGDLYLDPNPDRRTEEAIANLVSTDPQVSEILDQKKLDNGYAVNFSIGKSFKFSDKRLSISVNVNNITNNQDYITGGFENLRYDVQSISKFPPKLAFMYGANYFANIKFSF